VVGRLQRWMDRLGRAVQDRPALSRVVRRSRAVMRWFVPRALRRSAVDEAQAVMADAPAQPAVGPKILFVSFRSWGSIVAVDVTLAQGLRLRGARCEFFFCGGGLPICEMGWPAEEAAKPCASCGLYVASMVDAARFPRRSLDDLVPADERRAIAIEVHNGDAPGWFRGRALDPLVESSLSWLFRAAALPETDESRRARRDFRVGAAIMLTAAPRLLDQVAPDVVVVVNGLLYEDRIIREEAQTRGIRVVTYEAFWPRGKSRQGGLGRGTIFVSVGRPAPDNDISDLWERDGHRQLDENANRALEVALGARRRGTGLAPRYYRRPQVPMTRVGAPVVAVFTNVSWDTAVTGRELGFDSMFDWVTETVRNAQTHPELEFVIRAHPAESQIPGKESRDRVTGFIQRQFSTLPPNVRLVAPEEPLDSYALVEIADIVAVYTSTIGLEAAAAGKPVCVAGRTHYGQRGFTMDVTSPGHYRALFDDPTWAKPESDRQDRARRYAYLYFCRAMIPFPAVAELQSSEPTFAYTSVAELAPGREPYLDLVCDGILGRGDIRLP
jgi:Capsule polysaccharide biosynthesis protein